jgi:hypothetical protein
MKKTINTLVLILLVSVLSIAGFSQTPYGKQNGVSGSNGNSTNNNITKGPPVGGPIDGGLSILVLLGLGYGAKKVYSIKKQVIV